MRLQDVLNLPEKQYTQNDNGVQATIMGVENDAKQNQYGWTQTVTLKDLTGDQCRVKHQTKYPDSLLNEMHRGKQATWRLKWYRGGQSGKQWICGYPQTKVGEEGSFTAQQTTFQNMPQTPQNAPQSMNSEQPDKWQLKDECICRQAAGKAAAMVVAAYMSTRPANEDYPIAQAANDILIIADILAPYYIKGVVPAEEPDDIPFQ